jgi:hypothetical protein
MSYPAVLKKELVLSFKFKRVGASWKHAQQTPKVLRLANHDCSREFSTPLLIWGQSQLTVEARIYDDIGIDIAKATSLLGDWEAARRRCEELLVASERRADATAERELGPEIGWLVNTLMQDAINERH